MYAALVLTAATLPAAARAKLPTVTHEYSDSVTVLVDNLRNRRGLVRLCLTDRSEHFPECGPGSHVANVPIEADGVRHSFSGLRPGVYAIAAFHDANGDGRLDTWLGIPREGFAFSRNPGLHARAPRFGEASFVSSHMSVQHLRMRYLF